MALPTACVGGRVRKCFALWHTFISSVAFMIMHDFCILGHALTLCTQRVGSVGLLACRMCTSARNLWNHLASLSVNVHWVAIGCRGPRPQLIVTL